MILVFWMLSFKPTFSLSSFAFIKGLSNSSSLSAKRVVSSAYLRLLIFFPAMAVWGGLTNSCEKKGSEKQRRKGKIYPFECKFQRIARRDKKAFLRDQCKETEENNRMGKTRVPLVSLELQGDPTSPFWRRSALRFLWREWCWRWNSSALATSCEELTHWKRPWCWEGLGAGGEGDDRGWDGWMASLAWWMWVLWTPGVGDGQGGLACCDSWGRRESDTTEWLNWTELCLPLCYMFH